VSPEPFDVTRLWLGETPSSFLIEVAVRMLLLYAVLLARCAPWTDVCPRS
jgi:hypothetical protein